MIDLETFTDWREERLYVLHMIEDLKAEQRRQGEAAAVSRENVEKKLVKDLNAAYARVKALENSGIVMSVKNWFLMLILSAGGAIAFEVAKSLFQSHK